MSALTHLFCAAPLVAVEPAAAPTFSIGYWPVSSLTRREKLRASKRKPKPKRKLATSPAYIRHIPCPRGEPVSFLPPIVFIMHPKRWLLCYKGIPAPISRFLYHAGQTIPQIFKKIIAKRRQQKAAIARYSRELESEPSMEILTAAMTVAFQNQRVRNAFSAIAKRWIRSKLSVKNTEDLMTGEAPVKSITLVDWATRSIYKFEARTIARDMITRLTMSSCDFFPNPKTPRNPYTNELLTEGQFYSVVRQLRPIGETHWTLEALYSAKYNLAEFDRDMYPKLRRTIHNSIFANYSSDLAKGILLEFIEDEHEGHDKTYEKDIYKWAVETESMHNIIHEWRLHCSKYYKVKHFPGEKQENEAEMVRIGNATLRLCAYPAALVERYDAVHEKKYVKLADRVLPPPLGTTITVQLVNTLPVDEHSFMEALAADLLSDTPATVDLAATEALMAEISEYFMPPLQYIGQPYILTALHSESGDAMLAVSNDTDDSASANTDAMLAVSNDTDDSPSESD